MELLNDEYVSDDEGVFANGLVVLPTVLLEVSSSNDTLTDAFFFHDLEVEEDVPVEDDSDILPSEDTSFFSSLGFFQLGVFHDGSLGFSSSLGAGAGFFHPGVEAVLVEGVVGALDLHEGVFGFSSSLVASSL